jgi:DNA-binding MarR family transcriptional regulator
VALGSSSSDARQKVITLTPPARDYLAAQRAAARRIEQELAEQVGTEAFESLFALLEVLGGEEDQLLMRDYLRHALRLADDTERT